MKPRWLHRLNPVRIVEVECQQSSWARYCYLQTQICLDKDRLNKLILQSCESKRTLTDKAHTKNLEVAFPGVTTNNFQCIPQNEMIETWDDPTAFFTNSESHSGINITLWVWITCHQDIKVIMFFISNILKGVLNNWVIESWLMLWFKPSRHLSSTKPLSHSPPMGWRSESEGQKWENFWVEIKTI